MSRLLDEDIVIVARTLAETFFEAPLDRVFGPPPDGSDAQGSRVDVKGAFNGSVVIGCSDGLARRLAAMMFGVAEAIVTLDELRDATRELANIVAGNLKVLMPPPSEIGLPREIDELRGAEASLVNQMSFLCAGEPLVISVHEVVA